MKASQFVLLTFSLNISWVTFCKCKIWSAEQAKAKICTTQYMYKFFLFFLNPESYTEHLFIVDIRRRGKMHIFMRLSDFFTISLPNLLISTLQGWKSWIKKTLNIRGYFCCSLWHGSPIKPSSVMSMFFKTAVTFPLSESTTGGFGL